MEKSSNKKIIFLTILLGGLIVGLGIVIFMFVFNTVDKENNLVKPNNIIKKNTNESLNEIIVLNGLTFENADIIHQNGFSTLSIKVTNNDSVDYEGENFNIIIKDKNNNVIIELPGFISGGIKANESKNIISVVDIDLSSDAYYIECEEVK